MATYYVNEAVFNLPDRGFVDRTLHRLESALPGEDPLRVEVRRVPMEPGKSLRRHVEEEIEKTKLKVSGFTLAEVTEVTIAGAPAIVLRARLRARDTVHVQLQAHVALGETWIALVVSGPSAELALVDGTFDRVLQSLEWR